MSHNVGTLQSVTPAVVIGPDSGKPADGPNLWSFSFSPAPAPSGTKFVMLHFKAAALPASNRLEVDLGYATDVFTSADGSDFWTRLINVYALPGGAVPIRYVTNGATTGSVQIDQYGRGERQPGIQDPSSLSNCDPFLQDSSYTEPSYDPFWFCSPPPNWENARCEGAAGDVRSHVSPAVGMIVHVDQEGTVGLHLSTCSVTLIGPDLVISAGHCAPSPLDLARSASIVFGYEVNCDGSRLAGYSPLVCKMTGTVKQRYADGSNFDYWVMRIKVPPGGLGITPIQLRHDLPVPGEKIFGLHHPNGAVKKLSLPHPAFATVLSRNSTSINVPANFHVSGGSSGSGLFDVAGRILGVLSNGDPCGHTGAAFPLSYFPTATILPDLTAAPPPVTRDVMLVMDRSGSMSAVGTSGRSKIDEARDAASLFVQLVRTGTGNRVGLVSFSTTPSSPVDFALTAVTPASQLALVGPAPYAGGIVGGLAPGGNTTIGGGLEAARQQIAVPGTNPRSILLLTDGLQNTPPFIADVEGGLGSIDIDVIGYGTPANLDGATLNALASAHGGRYARGDTSLQLEKFFAQAFSNIFEAGLLMDPEFILGANQFEAPPIPFLVCEEERVTVVVGWDLPDAAVFVNVTTPLGNTVDGTAPGVEQFRGRTWTFLRIPLPQNGERDGTWAVNVFRPRGRGEFASGAPELHLFVNVVASGGAMLKRAPDRNTYYTGSRFNPRVQLQFAAGGQPPNGSLQLTVTRPKVSIGAILSKAKLAPPSSIGGDVLPARQATLAAIEASTGAPVVTYTDNSFPLLDDAKNTEGAFEAGGNFGNVMTDLFTVEGDYTFRARATYGDSCTATRELVWSIHVEVGVDPSRSTTTTNVTGVGPGGQNKGTVTVIPRDKYGNNLGPGAADSVTFTGAPGTTVTGPIQDNGDGSYTIPVTWNPSAGGPGVVIGQPGRPPVVIQPQCRRCWNKWWILVAALIGAGAGYLVCARDDSD